MKKAILISAIVLGASIIALVAVSGYAMLGRSLGQNWSSLDGPEPVWPTVVGFGSMWMIAISAVVLVGLLIAAAVVRSVRASRARAQRDDGVLIHS